MSEAPDSFYLAQVLVFFFLGINFGSFANVFIYRWPLGLSVVRPRSRCGQCGIPIKWYHNIPVLSYFLLRGQCANCGAKFSIRYPFVEMLTGLLFALAFLKLGICWYLLEVLIFIFGLVVCTFIDLDHFLLPDVLTLSGIVFGLVGALVNPERSFLDAVLGVALGGGLLWSVASVYYLLRKEEGLGGGDIKLLAWIGAILGWKSIAFVILSSSIIGSIVGLYMAYKSKTGMKTMIPFGPYLVFGALLWLFGGEAIGIWYLQLFFPSV